MTARWSRNVGLFGAEGQAKLSKCSVAVVGVGGLGTHVVQQLALLGVARLVLVDHEVLDETNLNRYVGVTAADVGKPKADLAARFARSLRPDIVTEPVACPLASNEAFAAISTVDHVFGCLDDDAPRLILTELTAAYAMPYFDLATDVEASDRLRFGGRVCVAWDGTACLVCLGVLDRDAARRGLESATHRHDEAAIYGVSEDRLAAATGPSVVSVNGVVASLGVTEFMTAATGLRPPHALLNYIGQLGKVTVAADSPSSDCYYCRGIRGQRAAFDAAAYLRQARAR